MQYVFHVNHYFNICGGHREVNMNTTMLLTTAIFIILHGNFLSKPGSDGAIKDIELCASCPQRYEPVCGTDNVTYSNLCFLDNCAEEMVDFLFSGKCRAPMEGCVATADINPVCGTDGETYKNVWDMFCSNTTMKYRGYC